MEQIAIYLRLSKEDEFVKDESNSITNQRAFIRGFINKNKELRKMSVVEFVDDGYSGKNMDRPDMQRMLEMVKRKQISCVIVKDDCVIIEPTQKDLENQGFVAGSICF